jgi:hypothetical protein
MPALLSPCPNGRDAPERKQDVIGVHLASVVFCRLRHRENLVRVMITGRK